MADIFEEVEEGLRQDRAARLWKKYGVFAYIAAALLIGGVALNEYLQYSKAQSIEESAMQFEQGVDELAEQNWQQASAALEPLVSEDTEIAPLSANYLAQARLEGTADMASAVEALEAAANTETPIGKLSLIKAAYLKSNSMSRAELETYLGALTNDPSAFGALALELIAAKAVAEGDIEFARTTFNELRFLANVPQGVEQRSRAALAALPPAVSTPATPQDTASETPVEPVQDEAEPGPGATDGDQPE
ncbi:MAG: tetratricopeptide repeat protein [Henriciella sp.]|uniref:tetratricopeptide repeat protein n=1 Tax=Henriciella sp. TaxID=1968823 RepID=UPI003C7351A1